MSTSDSPKRIRLTREQIESAARELCGALSEEDLRRIVDSSLEIESALDRIANDPLRLARRFADITSAITRRYIESYGDSPETRGRAMTAALDHLTRLHGISASKARLYIHAWKKFQARPEALEFLRMTDMQLLVGKHIGDGIIDAVIERRAADPTMSTREVKAFIAGLLRDEAGPAAHEGDPDAPSP